MPDSTAERFRRWEDLTTRDFESLDPQRTVAVFANTWSLGYPPGVLDADEWRDGIHGGLGETSILLHLRPELVRMQHARDFVPVLSTIEAEYQHLRIIGDVNIGWQAQDLHPDGVAGNAAGESAEIGERIVEHAAQAFAELIAEIARYPLSNLVPRPQ